MVFIKICFFTLFILDNLKELEVIEFTIYHYHYQIKMMLPTIFIVAKLQNHCEWNNLVFLDIIVFVVIINLNKKPNWLILWLYEK